MAPSDIARELRSDHFRVVIFGSARLAKDSKEYELVHDLARRIGQEGMDVVTGGGPGLMDAAMSGHFTGKREGSHEIGLQIKLPREQQDSSHFDIKAEFSRFSQRLDTFMALANAVVVAPGGVGTLLELLYTWQLAQVKMARTIPIILLGEMWPEFIEWIRKWPLRHKLLDAADLDLLYLATDADDAMVHLLAARDGALLD
jgi:uncharacterized protein (TIGR00730 family)